MAALRLREDRWWVRDWRWAAPTLVSIRRGFVGGLFGPRPSRPPRLVVRSISTAYPQGRFQGMRERSRGLAAQPFTGKNPPAGHSSLNPNYASESASLTGVKRLQLGNAI